MFEKILKSARKLSDLKERFRIANFYTEALKSLKNRSTCPTCNSTIDMSNVASELVSWENWKKELQEEHREWYRKGESERKCILIEREEREKLVREYLELNVSRIRKAIRDYRNGKETYLPVITDRDEMLLWNDAIDKYVGDRESCNNIDEYELMFEVENKK